ncbi:sensor histidine kinase [Desulfuribacillus alkaliarsenatis]|uniref:histidine kinase n=1 Tax=Desulfuribacillus alkaliarsenatis TaxID=766136 RepID=A0A1E5G3N9_9FIRM|nr:sensor histidine kinase [Desulfuribacillus alkaliarsenatis]OEF97698.1 histidine kinase [Desulfuribacillus alkaliarsenatis]
MADSNTKELQTGDVNLKVIDKVIKKTLGAIEQSKQQIYDIAEGAQKEMLKLKQELIKVHQEACEIVDKVDNLEKDYRRSRNHLAHVSKNFRNFSEQDIKKAYEDANHFQIELMLAREREQRLRQRRDELQIRLKNLGDTVAKAEQFVTQVGAVLGYLSGDLSNISDFLETAQQKQLMGIRVIQSQEEERKRVAREIHDGPAQLLANVVLRTEICERLLDRDLEKARQELKDLKDAVRNSLTEVRKIIFDLRPMALDDLGLVPTLRKYLTQFEERNQIATDIKIYGKEEKLEPAVVIAAFRIIQECLNNVAKHSMAKNASLKVEFRKDKLSGIVADDGMGFDLQEALKPSTESFGIIGIKERIELLQGSIEFDTAIGKGTKVFFNIPIHPIDEEMV